MVNTLTLATQLRRLTEFIKHARTLVTKGELWAAEELLLDQHERFLRVARLPRNELHVASCYSYEQDLCTPGHEDVPCIDYTLRGLALALKLVLESEGLTVSIKVRHLRIDGGDPCQHEALPYLIDEKVVDYLKPIRLGAKHDGLMGRLEPYIDQITIVASW